MWEDSMKTRGSQRSETELFTGENGAGGCVWTSSPTENRFFLRGRAAISVFETTAIRDDCVVTAVLSDSRGKDPPSPQTQCPVAG